MEENANFGGEICQKRSKMIQKTTVHRNSAITGSRNGHADRDARSKARAQDTLLDPTQ